MQPSYIPQGAPLGTMPYNAANTYNIAPPVPSGMPIAPSSGINGALGGISPYNSAVPTSYSHNFQNNSLPVAHPNFLTSSSTAATTIIPAAAAAPFMVRPAPIFQNSVAAAAYSAAAVAGLIDTKIDLDKIAIQTCHLHSKPQLSCKFCRKYKTAVHHQARLAMAQELQKPTEEKKNMVELTNTTTFNINNLLRENILTSEYFKSLFSLKTFSEIVDEIYQYADHAEPYCGGSSRAPSTLFCCLYKLFLMKLSYKQVRSLLDHVDSPYIRCMGFLYLRYAHPPEKLWDWFEPYFLDDEEFYPGVDKHHTETIGRYVEALITEDKYFNTVLPRLPVKIKTQYGAQLLALDEHRIRKKSNQSKLHLFTPGAAVQACSNGDWLEGRVVCLDKSLQGRISLLVKLEDDNEEYINLGLVKLIEEKKDKKEKEKKRKEHSQNHNNNSEELNSNVSYHRDNEEREEKDRFEDDIEKNSVRQSTKEKKSKKYKKHKRENRYSDSYSSDESYRRRKKHRHHHRSMSNNSIRTYSSIDSNRNDEGKRRHKDSKEGKRKHRGKGREKYSDNDVKYTNEEDENASNQKSQEELMIEFRRRERQKALATGKDYARRPTSYKTALSLRVNQTSRKRSRSPSRIRARNSVTREKEKEIENDKKELDRKEKEKIEDKKKEPSLEHKQKIAQLMEKYTKNMSGGYNRQKDIEGPDVMRLG